MKHSLFAMIGCFSLCLVTSGAHAHDKPMGFKTPSKNAACQLFIDDEVTNLRCDLLKIDVKPAKLAKPADCNGDYGHAFSVNDKGPSKRLCVTDTAYDPELPTLNYGQTWVRSGFVCKAEQARLTCFNTQKHGFSLSRTSQELF
jgi:hypothetical protein